MTTGNRELDSLLAALRARKGRVSSGHQLLRVADLLESAAADLRQAIELLRVVGASNSTQQ